MGDRADGTGDLNGSDISDCGLSPADVKDMKSSWTQNMDTVKAAILENHGFIWQQMVNNGTGTHPIVPKGAGCAATLRAACKPDSVTLSIVDETVFGLHACVYPKPYSN